MQKQTSKRLLKRQLENSQLAFTKFFFRARGEVFIPGPHHISIDETLKRVESGEIKNLVINIPPRFGKTQITVIDWMARCIARNPRAKFIHLSYSDELALDNSAKCRECVTSKEYQDFWPIKLKSDADSKKKWYTEQGGGVYATAAGGAVTGFGAGSLADVSDEEQRELDEADAAINADIDRFFSNDDQEPLDPNLFYGAIIIDDPIKVDDAYNEKERNRVNRRLNSTIKSRRNSRNTPIIIVMQRLHEEDMSGFVLNGGMEEGFYHLNLPACDMETQESLWPAKHTYEELMSMKIADHAVFMAQYMQDPTPDEGTFFLSEWFMGKRFRLGEEPTKLVKYGAGDYAVTEPEPGKQPDSTEQAIAGFDVKEDLWFLDWADGKTTIDKSIDTMMNLALDHDPVLWIMEKGVIKNAMMPFVEKEQRRRRQFFKVEALAATKSKAVNAKAFQGLCAQGKVHIPYGDWGDDLIAQLLKFTGRDDKEDDKVDVCGLFGRILGQAYGPATYHDEISKRPKDDYELEDDDDEYGYGTIPI